jgi:hypothetical protein
VADTYTTTQADNRFLTQSSASSTYLTQSSASTTYAPVAAGGLVLINSTSFTAQSTVSLNNIFSSTYDNYRFVFTTTSNSATGYLFMRLRSSGSDLTASSYNSSVIQAAYGSTALGNDAGSTNQSTWNRFGYYDGTVDALTITGDILLPFVSAFTSFNNTKARQGYGGEWSTGVYRATTSVDGITIYPSGGNITGSIQVYGYRK